MRELDLSSAQRCSHRVRTEQSRIEAIAGTIFKGILRFEGLGDKKESRKKKDGLHSWRLFTRMNSIKIYQWQLWQYLNILPHQNSLLKRLFRFITESTLLFEIQKSRARWKINDSSSNIHHFFMIYPHFCCDRPVSRRWRCLWWIRPYLAKNP